MVPEHGSVLHVIANVRILLFLATIRASSLSDEVRAELERRASFVWYQFAKSVEKVEEL